MFSAQTIYCNACGKRMKVELPNVIGRDYKCCSIECLEEMQWREALSTLGREYYPKHESGLCMSCKQTLRNDELESGVCDHCEEAQGYQ